MLKPLATVTLVVLGLLFLWECGERIGHWHWTSKFRSKEATATLAIRSPNEKLIWEYRPNATAGTISTNAFGFRERSFPSTDKPSDVIRIAIVGDSVTLGFRVREEDTFARISEQTLNDLHHSKRIEVLNFGVDGYSTEQIAELLQVRVLQFDPDITVYALCLNDFDTLISNGDKMRFFSSTNRIFLAQARKRIPQYSFSCKRIPSLLFQTQPRTRIQANSQNGTHDANARHIFFRCYYPRLSRRRSQKTKAGFSLGELSELPVAIHTRSNCQPS